MGTHSDTMTSVKQQAELSENLKMITKLYGDLDNQIKGIYIHEHILVFVLHMCICACDGLVKLSLLDR